MRKQSRYTLLAVVVVLAGLAVTLYLRWKAPPEVARLLPESDAIVYVSLKAIRTATHFDRTPVTRSANYQQFIDATGIVVERDLDAAAFALHRMADPRGPNGQVAFSEVFQGRFDRTRTAAYLESTAAGKETYCGHTIYSIPSEGRTLRAVILGYDLIGASNAPTPEQIHSIVDRFGAAASPSAGSSLLAARYSEVPAFSTIWGVGAIGLPYSENGQIEILGLQLPIPADAMFVASAQGFRLKVEELMRSEGEAAKSAEALTRLLNLLRAVRLAQPSTTHSSGEEQIQELVDSVKIDQKKDHVVITAAIPKDALKALTDR